MRLHTPQKSPALSSPSRDAAPHHEVDFQGTVQLLDNRPEARVQQALHESMNASARLKPLNIFQEKQGGSPHVQQLSAYQDMADHAVQRKAKPQAQPTSRAQFAGPARGQQGLPMGDTSEVMQLKRVDVQALDVTHLVQLNENGSLYQQDYLANEVAETRPGDSVVIEDTDTLLSRRGPNQEQDPTRDADDKRTNLWTNAIAHNDLPLPANTYIRNGTFAARDGAPKVVANLASGTVDQTLMHPYADGQQVVNIDSGHMAVADAVCALVNPEVIRAVSDLAITHIPTKIQFPKAHADSKARLIWLSEKMTNKKTFASNLKTLLHTAFPGAQGVLSFLQHMPTAVKEAVEKQLSTLKDFEHGDLATAAQAHRQGFDVVHMVNAFGFDPIDDQAQVLHLATMLKAGGRLVITAEQTGPTVFPLFGDFKGGRSEETLLAHVQANFAKHPLSAYFEIGALVYLGKGAVNYGDRSQVMPKNQFTAPLNTRHTMPSDGGTDMKDAPTVQVTFVRNAKGIDVKQRD